MAANPGKEQWYIKENGGSGESVGIASTNSNWFIAENVLRDNAEMICRLWNEQAADTKEQNFNNHQHSNGAEPAEISCATCNSPGALAEGTRCNECNTFSEWRN